MPIHEESELEVWSQQILLPDASVYSRQWLQIRHEVQGSFGLLDLYLAHIRRCTGALIRPKKAEGSEIHFQLLGSSLSLLSFSPPEIQQDSHSYSVSLSLCGGFLVQAGECHRGRFRLAEEKNDGCVTVSVELSDYCPLLLGSSSPSPLRKALYRLTQAYIHKVVTVRFLAALHLRLTGRRLPVKVKTQPTSEGEDI